MDNLTHSLVGALIGQAGLKRKTGFAMPALIIGANLPDIDAACLFWVEGVEHLAIRRGITHGPVAWVLLPLVLAGLLWGWDRWQTRRGKRPEKRLPVHIGWLYALGLIGCLSHPALDWLNVYGVRLLEPFSSEWFYGDTLFIIDVWLWGLMGLGLWFSLRRERRGQGGLRLAQGVLAAALVYIGFNAALSGVHTKRLAGTLPTLECAENAQVCGWTIIASPVPVYFWQREMILDAPVAWSAVPVGKRATYENARPIADQRCALPPGEAVAGNDQATAFLFWSRAPFAERAEDGSVILRDARYYDPRARDRFSVSLADVACEPLDE